MVIYKKMRFCKHLCMLLLALGTVIGAKGQDVAVKTNLLYDALLSPNLGVEVELAPRWSIDLSGQINNWTVNQHKWKHWLVQPEIRYWFCDHFAGHFLGAHLLGGQYNMGNIKNGISFLGSDLSKLTDHRYQGWDVGLGIAYGYAFILGRHWNLELELGLGYVYTRYDVFECKDCGMKVQSDKPHHYVGPTKAAVNLVYVF